MCAMLFVLHAAVLVLKMDVEATVSCGV